MNHTELIRQLTPLHGAAEARAIVRLLMEESFHLSLTDLLLDRDRQLTADQQATFSIMAARLLRGEPVQHVLGYATFCGRRFRVSPDVLIPRPETEELVRLALQKSAVKILDLCTGSGCIAISLALARPEAQVTAVDVSPSALDVARQNAAELGAENVRFLQRDVLKITHTDSLMESAHDGFQLLVSNPPYVRRSEAGTMSPTVLEHEPHLALFVPDEDPLCFYRSIAQLGRHLLSPGGWLVVEVNTALARQTCELMAQQGFQQPTVHPDQFDRPRIITAQKL